MDKNYVTCRAKYDLPDYCGLSNEITLKVTSDEYFSDRFGLYVGSVSDTGKRESRLVTDGANGDTANFDRLMNDIELIEKRLLARDYETGECYLITRYYVPYVVDNHSSSKPMVLGEDIDFIMNAKYKIICEYLFVAEDGFTRYLTIPAKTVSLWGELNVLESTLRELFEEEKFGFGRDEYGCKTVVFYDDVGEACNVDAGSGDLLDMLVSVRIVSIESETIYEA